MPTRKYAFYGRESDKHVYIKYSFGEPFYENLEAKLRFEYGSELTYLRLIDHERQIIKEHTAYDSGKGCVIIKRTTKPTKEVLRDFFNDDSKTIIRFYPRRNTKREILEISKSPTTFRYGKELIGSGNIRTDDDALKKIVEIIKTLVKDTSCFEST